MNQLFQPSPDPMLKPEPAGEMPSNHSDTPATGAQMRVLAEGACQLLAPAFDLRDLIAVNPFLGFVGRPFHDALVEIEALFHADVLPSVRELRASYGRGEFDAALLREALADQPASSHRAAETLIEEFERLPELAPRGPRLECVADLVPVAVGSKAHGLRESLLRFLSAREDVGVSRVQDPLVGLPLLEAYRLYARADRSVSLAGVSNFDAWLASLPDQPMACLAWLAEGRFGLPELTSQFANARHCELYLARLLVRIPGFAGLLRSREFPAQGGPSQELLGLLAIVLLHDRVLAAELGGTVRPKARAPEPGYERDRMLRLAALRAREQGYARALLAQLSAPGVGSSVGPAASPTEERPSVQALFCIDVRSERARVGLERAGEAQGRHIDTYGFAGFFGVPMAVGTTQGERAHCPPLLAPALRFDASKLELAARPPSDLRSAGLSSLSYVELWGVKSLINMLRDAVTGDPGEAAVHEQIDIGALGFETKLSLGRALLKNSSLSAPYARLVVLFGHGSEVTNNPQAASLACGACAGHSGALSARVAASALRDPRVLGALREEGFEIAEDVVFVAGLHDTMTDELRLLDTRLVPGSHAQDLRELEILLARGGELARGGRGPAPEFAPADSSLRSLQRRAKSPAEIQPEWGLAGNAAFIIGGRKLTRNVSLSGRSFLHSYDAARDPDGSVLRMILTAPAIVGAWISYQYYGSTVAPEVLSSGNKTLHNVVGGVGVAEGGLGDLAVGLSQESLFFEGRAVHELLRLQLVVEAPEPLVARLLEEEPSIGDLVRGGWVGLHLVEPGTGKTSTFSPHPGTRKGVS